MPPTHPPRIPHQPTSNQQTHPRSAREFTTLPSTYSYTPHLPAGTIVGIVLGSVLGFLLLLYLVYLALTSGRKFSPSTTHGDGGTGTILSGSSTTTSSPSSHSEIIVEENLSSTRSPRSHRSRRSRRPGGGGRTTRRREEIIEAYVPAGRGRLHAPHSKHHQNQRNRPHPHPPDDNMVEASVGSSERSDVVTVMEEHSSVEGHHRQPRRPGKGGYRAVDLDAVEGLSVDGSLRS